MKYTSPGDSFFVCLFFKSEGKEEREGRGRDGSRWGGGVTQVVDGTCPGNTPVQPARGWRALVGGAQT